MSEELIDAMELLGQLRNTLGPIMEARHREFSTVCVEINTQCHVTLNTTCHACPVQIEGRLHDGKYVYFRSRGDCWAFHVAQSKDHIFDHDIFLLEGETESDGGWLDPAEARRLVMDGLMQYEARDAGS